MRHRKAGAVRLLNAKQKLLNSAAATNGGQLPVPFGAGVAPPFGGKKRKGGFLGALVGPALSLLAPIVSNVLGTVASTAVAKKMGSGRKGCARRRMGGKKKLNPGLLAYLEKKHGRKFGKRGRAIKRGRGAPTFYN